MVYVINLDECKSIRTHWIVLYVNSNVGRASYDAILFDYFGAEHIPKEIKIHRKQKYHNTDLYNTSVWLNNVLIHLYEIYWFYAKRKKFATLYDFIFS